MQLLCVHRNLKLELGLKWHSRDAEECHLAFLVEVSFMLALHLCLLLGRSQFLFLVAV